MYIELSMYMAVISLILRLSISVLDHLDDPIYMLLQHLNIEPACADTILYNNSKDDLRAPQGR